jgi:hypothetical protein
MTNRKAFSPFPVLFSSSSEFHCIYIDVPGHSLTLRVYFLVQNFTYAMSMECISDESAV